MRQYTPCEVRDGKLIPITDTHAVDKSVAEERVRYFQNHWPKKVIVVASRVVTEWSYP